MFMLLSAATAVTAKTVLGIIGGSLIATGTLCTTISEIKKNK